MPEKPRPKAADTANSPTSFWVSRKAPIATAWQRRPGHHRAQPADPIGQAPQNCREMKAQASSTDSIAAPCVGTMPRSAQKATRCEVGTAIGMQQQNAAMQINPRTRFGGMPRTDCALARIAGHRVCGRSGSGAGAAQQGQRQDHHNHHGGIRQHRRLPADTPRCRARRLTARRCRRYTVPTRSRPAPCRGGGRTSG